MDILIFADERIATNFSQSCTPIRTDIDVITSAIQILGRESLRKFASGAVEGCNPAPSSFLIDNHTHTKKMHIK